MISVSQADEQSTFFRYWIFTYIKKQEELEMKSYEEMTKEELLKEKEGLEAEYKKFQQRGLKLDMSYAFAATVSVHFFPNISYSSVLNHL